MDGGLDPQNVIIGARSRRVGFATKRAPNLSGLMPASDPRRDARLKAISAMTPEQKKRVRTLAEGEMYLAACAVSQQMRRLQSGEQPGPEYMADGRLFAESLRAAIRAGALCALLAEPNEASAIEAALNRLFESVPSSVDVRDVLEHFDDYLVGAGDLQKNGPTEFTQAYGRGSS